MKTVCLYMQTLQRGGTNLHSADSVLRTGRQRISRCFGENGNGGLGVGPAPDMTLVDGGAGGGCGCIDCLSSENVGGDGDSHAGLIGGCFISAFIH